MADADIGCGDGWVPGDPQGQILILGVKPEGVDADIGCGAMLVPGDQEGQMLILGVETKRGRC